MIRLDLKEYEKQNDYENIEKFGAVKHVLSACAPSSVEKREHIISLYVTEDKKRIACTDGRRLHASDNVHDWEPGFYGPIKNLKKLIILVKKEIDPVLFPNFNPNAEFPEFGDIINVDKCASFEGVKLSNSMTDISTFFCDLIDKTECVFNFEYISKAVEFIEPPFYVFKKAENGDDKYYSIIIRSNQENFEKVACVMAITK